MRSLNIGNFIMKALLSVVLSSVVLTATMSSAMAVETQKVIRNDRVTVTQGIAQYDINPFVDQKRVMRNDRVNYNLAKTEKKAVKQERIVRNDRVVFSKVIAKTHSSL